MVWFSLLHLTLNITIIISSTSNSLDSQHLTFIHLIPNHWSKLQTFKPISTSISLYLINLITLLVYLSLSLPLPLILDSLSLPLVLNSSFNLFLETSQAHLTLISNLINSSTCPIIYLILSIISPSLSMPISSSSPQSTIMSQSTIEPQLLTNLSQFVRDR